jgi:hypothetical protein
VTRKDSYEQYLGSGVYWKNHLNKYGTDISTEVLVETEFMDELRYYGIMFSLFFNIVESPYWANLIIESGYDVDGTNFKQWWGSLSNKEKTKFIKNRNEKIKQKRWNEKTDEELKLISNKISESLRNRWISLSEKEKETQIASLNEGFKNWYSSLSDEEKEKRNKNISQQASIRITKIDKDEFSKKMRERRLNLSEEKKKDRADKCRLKYADGRHDHLFEKMAKERIGAGNPAARRVMFDGVEYDTIKQASESTGIEYHKVRKLLKGINDDKNHYLN